MVCIIFFAVHWQLSVFCQSFFLHRYGAHRQFKMSKGWERFFHLLTWVSQGSSYLSPRAYAILHRMHHAYADTPKDPHSPVQVPNLFAMMWQTKKIYRDLRMRAVEPEPRFDGGYPVWQLLDGPLSGWGMSVAWGTAYSLFYIAFATSPWLFLLLPLHWFLGPVHGAIVNWCGHKYGYRNFNGHDASRNTLFFDFLTGGELFQNNHHEYGMSPKFAARWFEVDTTYLMIRGLAALKIVDLSGAQVMRYTPARTKRPFPPPSIAMPSPMDAE